MSNAATVQQILKCDNATANAITEVMYQYISPSWSNDTAASLRADLKVVAELAGIKIVPMAKAARATKSTAAAVAMFGPEVLALRDATLAARARTGKHIATSVSAGQLFRAEEHISRGARKSPEIKVLAAPMSLAAVTEFIKGL